MKHLRSIDDIGGREGAEKLFRFTDHIKANESVYKRKALNDKIIASLFFEASTGTRITSEAAALWLGADVIPVSGEEATSLAKGESIEDTVRRIMGCVDAIILRHKDDNSAHRAAAVSSIPIIGGGAGKAHHTTQAILDVYTMREYKKRVDELCVAVIGDLQNGRTVHSLIELLTLYDKIKIFECSVNGLELPQKYINTILERGGEYKKCENIEDIPHDADALYCTRIQQERLEFPSEREKKEFFTRLDYEKEKTRIDSKKLSCFSKDTLIMHPLPRNSNNGESEITNEVVGTGDQPGDPRCIIFEQATNGFHTRKAVLMTCMGMEGK